MLAAPHAGGGRAGKRMMAAADGLRAFGTLLRQHRTAAGLSQEELAERAGLSRRGISDLERGVHGSPHPATVRRLAEALDLDQAQRAALLASAQAGLQARHPISHSCRPRPAGPSVLAGAREAPDS
jgi:transcriptional regulator with XRE-family HTH domain